LLLTGFTRRNFIEDFLSRNAVLLEQKSDSGFPDFSRTKLVLFPDLSRHFFHLHVNKNITKGQHTLFILVSLESATSENRLKMGVLKDPGQFGPKFQVQVVSPQTILPVAKLGR